MWCVGALEAQWHCSPLPEGLSDLGLCPTDFTPLEEVHIVDQGSAFIPSLHIFSWSLCVWPLLLLKLEGPSWTQDSGNTFVCLDMDKWPCCCCSRYVLPVVESSLAAPSLCHEICSGFPPFTDPCTVFVGLLLHGRFITESIFCCSLLFGIPNLFRLYCLVFSDWSF